jgi:hypothetical protein
MKRQRNSTINKRQEAQDPQTEPARLATLARSSSAEIGALVAQNPNATFDTLSTLAEKYPKQVLQNPSLLLLLLENPLGLLQFSAPAQRALVWCEDVSVPLLRIYACSTDESVQNIVATCPKTPLDVLQTLSTSRSAYTRELVARHPSCDQDTLLRLCTDPERSVRTMALRRCSRFAEQLKMFSAALSQANAKYFSESLWIQETHLPGPLIEALFQSGGELALLWVAMHPASPEPYLRDIALKAPKAPELFSALLANPSLPPSLLASLLSQLLSERSEVGIFFQPNLPTEHQQIGREWLQRESTDIEWLAAKPIAEWAFSAIFEINRKEARLGLAQNPKLPIKYFQHLFETFDFQVACELAQNQSTPSELLARLATDWAPLTESQTAFDFTFDHMRSALQRLVAQNPKLPVELFATLASSSDVMVRKALAQNPKLPPRSLDALATDPADLVRASCASHPKLTATLCRLLAKDPEPKVRQKMALRADLSAALAYQLFDEDEQLHAFLAENAQTPAALLERLAIELPTYVARNPNAPPAILARLSRQSTEEMLDWVARHPNTPVEVLKRLSSSKVREVALLHPALETAWLYQQKFIHHSEDIPF